MRFGRADWHEVPKDQPLMQVSEEGLPPWGFWKTELPAVADALRRAKVLSESHGFKVDFDWSKIDYGNMIQEPGPYRMG